MIVFNLSCSSGHRFEGWFGSADEFLRQSTSGEVTCPMCGDTQIVRLPAGTHLKRRRDAGAERQAAKVPEVGVTDTLRALTRALMRDSEDVGDRFPEEARKIHYEEAPARRIRGIATLQETGELLEEGIIVLPLPPERDLH